MKNPMTTKYYLVALTVMLLVSFGHAARLEAAVNSKWTPVVTDNLVRLDVKAMDRELGRQFADSVLAREQAEVDHKITEHAQAINGLQQAIQSASDDATRQNLALREIDERAALISKLERRTDLRTQKAKSQLDAYSQIWSRIKRYDEPLTPSEKQFVAAQNNALERIDKASVAIEVVQDTPGYGTSQYQREYTRVAQNIFRLQDAINRHTANTARQAARVPLSKSEYVTQRLIAAQGELALALEEKKLTGFMAKILSLDAIAFRDDLQPASEDSHPTELPVAHADNLVDLFLK